MKDSEFIALLNLYLDQEITAADAVALEAEVQRNPTRRELYQDYCRMHKAGKILARDFQAETILEKKVVGFPIASSTRRGGWYAAAGLAAAACFAFLLVNRSSNDPLTVPTSAPTMANNLEVTPDLILKKGSATDLAEEISPGAISRVEMTPSRLAIIKRALVQNVLDQASTTQAVTFTAMGQSNQFDWMRRVQLAPVQTVPVENLRFDARPANPAKVPAFQNPEPLSSPAAEMTAFRFQR